MSSAHYADRGVDNIIADPLFKRGYAEIFDRIELSTDIRWTEDERKAYKRGRQFGLVVLDSERERLPLYRGSLVHPRTRAILQLAMKTGEVR